MLNQSYFHTMKFNLGDYDLGDLGLGDFRLGDLGLDFNLGDFDLIPSIGWLYIGQIFLVERTEVEPFDRIAGIEWNGWL